MERLQKTALVALMTLAISVGSASQELPKTTKEGLELASSEGGSAVYIRPETNLGRYENVHILKAYVAFKENWARDYNRTVLRSNRITDADLEQIKERLEEGFRQSFSEEFSNAGYAMVGRSGENVLILRPALLDVTMESPKSVTDSSRGSVVDFGSGTQMSLVLDMYDAATSELVARVFNREAGNNRSNFAVDSGSLNRAVESRIFRNWADSVIRVLRD